MVWLEIDPLHFLGSSNFIWVALRISVYILAGEEFFKTACGLIIVSLMCLAGFIQIIARCNKLVEKTPNSEVRVMKVYTELQLWNDYGNQNFCRFAVPPLILFGMCTIIFTSYGTIRFPGKIHFLIYWIAPATSLGGYLVLSTILPRATMVWGTSQNFLGFLKGRCYSKYEVRLRRSLRAVGIAVGQFGYVTNSWAAAIWMNIVNYTVDLLLAF